MTKNTINNVNQKNNFVSSDGRIVFIARKNERVVDFAISRYVGKDPKVISAPTIYEASSYGNIDTQSMALAIATGRIENAVKENHKGYIHIYADIRIVLKYREVIANRGKNAAELEDIVVKEFMNEAQASIVRNFARAIRAAAEKNIIVSFIDWRSINFLEFSNPENKPVKVGDKLTFQAGACGSMKTYGPRVSGVFNVVESTRKGEEGRLLLDIRRFGSPNNPDSMLAFARKTYNVLQNKLMEGHSLMDLLGESTPTEKSSENQYDVHDFDMIA